MTSVSMFARGGRASKRPALFRCSSTLAALAVCTRSAVDLLIWTASSVAAKPRACLSPVILVTLMVLYPRQRVLCIHVRLIAYTLEVQSKIRTLTVQQHPQRQYQPQSRLSKRFPTADSSCFWHSSARGSSPSACGDVMPGGIATVRVAESARIVAERSLSCILDLRLGFGWPSI